MRTAILGLLLYAGTTALCQSTAPSPATPNWQNPLVVTPRARDFSKLPPGWHFSGAVPPRILLQPKMLKLPKPETNRPLVGAEIDPKIVVHPPQSSIGVNPPGTPMAQNEYPHLQMRPIEAATQIHQR
jgi:hypothetical protein